MTSMGNNTWKATITTPLAAKSALNVVFTNGSTWDNNNSANWSIPVTNSSGSTGSTGSTEVQTIRELLEPQPMRLMRATRLIMIAAL
ncbi:hypothetical protein D3C87_1918680 [compost metagenome]